MKLILMRHAEAEPASAGRDSERALTAEGQDMARRMGKLLLDTGWKLREIRHSPLLRTSQTARCVSENFVPEPEMISEQRLAPGSGPAEATEMLSQADPNDV
ncbi:MAG: histidine phosphatase family protein, partial [Spirochaetales bacterium]|nr:histidine phosphatase family protein [Spirochaetales bacterium]